MLKSYEGPPELDSQVPESKISSCNVGGRKMVKMGSTEFIRGCH